MAKSALRIRARELRRKSGESIVMIAKKLKVSKGTVSLWCRDIQLSQSQIQNLLDRKENGLRLGQVNGALVQKNKRIKIIKQYQEDGLKEFKQVSDREYLVFGLALYLAEGAKKSRRIEFVNSDPQLIRFMRHWFVKFFSVPREHFSYRFTINETHRARVDVVTKFWSEYLNIPQSEFKKPVFVKAKHKKIYANHDNYFGTFRLSVLKGSSILYRILGLIEGLLASKKEPA